MACGVLVAPAFPHAHSKYRHSSLFLEIFYNFICRSLSAIIQGATPIFKDVNHINPADNMPAMVVYILFSEIVISCEYIPLVDIIPIISHRRKSLEQPNVIAAVYPFVRTSNKTFDKSRFCAGRNQHIGDKRAINSTPGVITPHTIAITHPPLQPFYQLFSLLRILDTDKARCSKFHTISPIQIRKPPPTGCAPKSHGRTPCR